MSRSECRRHGHYFRRQRVARASLRRRLPRATAQRGQQHDGQYAASGERLMDSDFVRAHFFKPIACKGSDFSIVFTEPPGHAVRTLPPAFVAAVSSERAVFPVPGRAACPAESSLRSCRTVRPSTGCTRSGNISSSGASTKSRRSRSGCGIVSRSLRMTRSSVEQHVDVHRPRAVARIRRSHPSQYPLDTLAFVEYPLGRQWGFDREHRAQVIVRRLRIPMVPTL